MADMDGDGDLDGVALIPTLNSGVILINDAAGSFATSQFATAPAPSALAIVDSNQDGAPDVAITSTASQRVHVHPNDGLGTVLNPDFSLVVGANPIDVVATDFNHDGLPDLAVLSVDSASVSILINEAGGSFVLDQSLTLNSIPTSLLISDFDQDGNFDLAAATLGGLEVYFGVSSATELVFTTSSTILPTTIGQTVAAADLNGDEFPDLLGANQATNELHFYFSDQDGTFRGPVIQDTGANATSIVTGDFNGDGRIDVATTHSAPDGASILLQGPEDAYLVTVLGEQQVFGLDFGNFRNGRITGTKFEDHNCETSVEVEGITIYLDLDDDGEHDPNEPFEVTDANGAYEFTNVPPGTYSVREVITPPFTQSFPETFRHIVTISQTNQTVSDIDFGNFVHTPLPDGTDYIYGFDANDRILGDNVVTDVCILSLGDDDHLFGMRGDDHLEGQLRNDTYHFEQAVDTGVETDTIVEREDGGTNERFDEGIFDQLNFDGVPEKNFPGVGPAESVLADLSAASPVFTVINQIVQHERVGSGRHIVVTGDADQEQFIEQLVGGEADDILVGNDRANYLDGRDGSDLEFGAAGDDTYAFVPGQPGDNDQLVETIGSDTLDFSQIPDAVIADLSATPVLTTAPVIASFGAETVETAMPELFENIIGTTEGDQLRGSAEDNHLMGRGESDLLIGLEGNDTLEGGLNSDRYEFYDNFGVDEVIERTLEGTNDEMDFSAVTVALDFAIGTQIEVSDASGNAVHHEGLNVELVIGGGTMLDTLTSGDGANTWIISGEDTGTLNGVEFRDIEMLSGGAGPDTFIFLPGGSITGTVFGGGGPDVFDFVQGGSVGSIDGGANNDSILGNDDDRIWTIDGVDTGTATGIGPFNNVESLVGGSGADQFDLDGGQLSGAAVGAGGPDVLNGDDVETAYEFTGIDSGSATGVMTGVASFLGIETINAGGQDDLFQLMGGSNTGEIDGGGGTNTLSADDVPTVFTITGTDEGSSTGVASFRNIANLNGNASGDEFVFTGGDLTGSVDGRLGIDTIVTHTVANTFELTGVNAGAATGIGVGFQGVENLRGNNQNDSLTMNGGTLTGIFRGQDGIDTIIADDVASDFATIGPNTGYLTGIGTGIGLFAEVEELIGGAANDSFTLLFDPFEGSIEGRGGANRLSGGFSALDYHVTGPNSGSVNGLTTFVEIGDLFGGFEDDVFELDGGTIDGAFDGRAGIDTIIADDVINDFTVTGTNAGVLTAVAPNAFSNIENLSGGSQDDTFTLSGGGTIDGLIDGADGSDTLVADDVTNVFTITGLGSGELTGTGGFTQIETLVGGTSVDLFVFNGGTLDGSIDGGDSLNDTLVADSNGTSITVDGVDSGQLTEATGGFANIENIIGGNGNDEIEVTDSGEVTGLLAGLDGDDNFTVQPGGATTLLLFGGLGTDTLIVDGQAIPPVDVPPDTVNVGAATVTYNEIEHLQLACDVCATEANAVANLAIGMVGHFDSTEGLDIGFRRLFRDMRRQHARRRGAILAATTTDQLFERLVDDLADPPIDLPPTPRRSPDTKALDQALDKVIEAGWRDESMDRHIS